MTHQLKACSLNVEGNDDQTAFLIGQQAGGQDTEDDRLSLGTEQKLK